jgi:hypothetical protein
MISPIKGIMVTKIVMLQIIAAHASAKSAFMPPAVA